MERIRETNREAERQWRLKEEEMKKLMAAEEVARMENITVKKDVRRNKKEQQIMREGIREVESGQRADHCLVSSEASRLTSVIH